MFSKMRISLKYFVKEYLSLHMVMYEILCYIQYSTLPQKGEGGGNMGRSFTMKPE